MKLRAFPLTMVSELPGGNPVQLVAGEPHVGNALQNCDGGRHGAVITHNCFDLQLISLSTQIVFAWV